MIRYLLLFPLPLLLLSSCFSPKPIARLEPVDKDAPSIRWFYGNAYVGQTLNAVRVETAFLDADRDYLIFDVEVTNDLADQAVLIDPKHIKLEGPNGNNVRAVNPEVHRLTMDMDASRREANEKNALVATGVVILAGTIAAIASDSDGDGDSFEVDDVNIAVDLSPLAINAILAATSPVSASYYLPGPEELPPTTDRLFWLDHALRRTHVQPGERVYGKVVFPRVDEWRNAELVVPLEERIYRFAFRQRLFKP